MANAQLISHFVICIGYLETLVCWVFELIGKLHYCIYANEYYNWFRLNIIIAISYCRLIRCVTQYVCVRRYPIIALILGCWWCIKIVVIIGMWLLLYIFEVNFIILLYHIICTWVHHSINDRLIGYEQYTW